jgi:hypothetical protein
MSQRGPVPHVLTEMFLGSGPSGSAKSLNDGMLYEDSRVTETA